VNEQQSALVNLGVSSNRVLSRHTRALDGRIAPSNERYPGRANHAIHLLRTLGTSRDGAGRVVSHTNAPTNGLLATRSGKGFKPSCVRELRLQGHKDIQYGRLCVKGSRPVSAVQREHACRLDLRGNSPTQKELTRENRTTILCNDNRMFRLRDRLTTHLNQDRISRNTAVQNKFFES